jgi:hypothetical protein
VADAKKHYTEIVATRLRTEAMTNAKAVAASLAPPDKAFDGQVVSRAQYVEQVRTMSLEDERARAAGETDPNKPTYLETVLDNMAPAAIPGPNGTMLRAETGLDNFLELMEQARPDLYARVSLEQEG